MVHLTGLRNGRVERRLEAASAEAFMGLRFNQPVFEEEPEIYIAAEKLLEETGGSSVQRDGVV